MEIALGTDNQATNRPGYEMGAMPSEAGRGWEERRPQWAIEEGRLSRALGD